MLQNRVFAMAVDAYLKDHPEFTIDQAIDDKLLISVAPRGFLRRS